VARHQRDRRRRSPSYHAIKLFTTHLGDEIVKASAADTDVLVSVNRDSSRPLYLHLVNPDSAAVPVGVNITGPRFGPPGRRSSLGASRRTRTRSTRRNASCRARRRSQA
jgi:hypothetical protein